MRFCKLKLFLVSLTAGLLVFSGCGRERPTANTPSSSVSVDGSKYLLGSEPEGGAGVIKSREETKDEEDVVIVGRIGGSENPWVDGRAAFSIVDLSLKSCADIGSDNCPKPWDFC